MNTPTNKCSKHGVVHRNGGYPSCPANKKKKVVKVWGVVNYDTSNLLEAYPIRADAWGARDIICSHNPIFTQLKVVPCTITYELPLQVKKKSK